LSRLTTLPVLKDSPAGGGGPAKIDHLGPFNFRDMGGWFLLSNDSGQHLMVDEADFRRVLADEVKESEPLYGQLEERGFLRRRIDFRAQATAYAKQTAFRHFNGPSLHMIVVTLRCNQKCQYCHSSVVHPSRTDTDMDLATAKKTVDFIFRTPNPTICIEFQGGEPLLNWPVVKFIVEYAQAKAKATDRRLIMALVCNFTLMTEERLQYLLDKHVSICTSLDGPAELHDKNRPFIGGGNAQAKVVAWLKDLQARCRRSGEKGYYLPGALMTTTRFSLEKGREIVDLYVELGMEQIFLRPLSPIGYAKRVWGEIGYAPQQFAKFYEDTLDYILELNRTGKSDIMERMALVMLTKILKGEDPGFMDLRAPAGAVLGCVAYNYNGQIFVSDEGRMVDQQGDPIFKIGDVADSSWDEVMKHPTTRACATASTLENQPMCAQCAYKPYCGVEPVFHYETQHSIYGQTPSSYWCIGHMGMFDALFKRLRDPKDRAIFDSWMRRDQCRWQESDAVAAGEPHQEVKA
jgi:uncharacterized protein